MSSTFSRNYNTFQTDSQVLVLSLIGNSVSISANFLVPKELFKVLLKRRYKWEISQCHDDKTLKIHFTFPCLSLSFHEPSLFFQVLRMLEKSEWKLTQAFQSFNNPWRCCGRIQSDMAFNCSETLIQFKYIPESSE